MHNQVHIIRLRLLTALTILLTLSVIALGVYTRLSDAGLGCPDWPGCYGQLTVPQSSEEVMRANQLFPERAVEQDKAWAEMIHRYFAGTLGLLVIALSAILIKQAVIGIKLPAALSLLVIAQALLGMWTVTLKLMPVIVLAHLFGGFTLLSLLLVTYLRLGSPDSSEPPVKPVTRLLAVAALVTLIVQIFLGGWTSSNYAALMCTSLPVCQGDWVNQLDFKTAFSLYQPGHENYEFGVLDYPARMTIHVSHRIGAIITVLITLLLCWRLYSETGSRKASLTALLGLLTCQVSLGIANVLFQLPITVAVLHNLVAALLLACLVQLNYRLLTAGCSIQTSTSNDHYLKGHRYE